MSLERSGPLVPVDDAIVHVSEAELDFDAPPDEAAAVPPETGRAVPARLVVRSWRGRLLGPILTRLMGWLAGWTAYELRREYLSRLSLAEYRHQKALAAAQKKAAEWQARAETLSLEKALLSDLHVNTAAYIESSTLARKAKSARFTRSDEE